MEAKTAPPKVAAEITNEVEDSKVVRRVVGVNLASSGVVMLSRRGGVSVMLFGEKVMGLEEVGLACRWVGEEWEMEMLVLVLVAMEKDLTDEKKMGGEVVAEGGEGAGQGATDTKL